MHRLEQAGVVIRGPDGKRAVASEYQGRRGRAGTTLDNLQPIPTGDSAVKYQAILNKIHSGSLSRAELRQMRENAAARLVGGDLDAQVVVDAIDLANPADKTMVFMGFCPNAELANRQDTEWKARGICTFDYVESESQAKRFNEIWPGDLIILKKRHEFGKTMRLYGHGRVTGVKSSDAGLRYLEMAWSDQDEVIEVPLMGCNSTVDVRTIEQVEAEMPEAFYQWLNKDLRAAA